jgi:hypothetical protein
MLSKLIGHRVTTSTRIAHKQTKKLRLSENTILG